MPVTGKKIAKAVILKVRLLSHREIHHHSQFRGNAGNGLWPYPGLRLPFVSEGAYRPCRCVQITVCVLCVNLGSLSYSALKVKQNVVPSPGVEATQMRPLWRSMIFLVIVSPAPVPPSNWSRPWSRLKI